MRNRFILFSSLLLLVFSAGCGGDAPLFDIVPEIYFVSITPETTAEGVEDGLKIVIHFQDGDGDLGLANAQDGNPNLFIRDTRSNVPDSLGTFEYRVPNLSPDTRKPSIQGTIEITMSAPYLTRSFIPPYVGPSSETVIFDIYLVDRAGHSSNHILSSPLTVSN